MDWNLLSGYELEVNGVAQRTDPCVKSSPIQQQGNMEFCLQGIGERELEELLGKSLCIYTKI